MAESVLLKQVAEDMAFIKKKVLVIEHELKELDSDFHTVRPSYIKKLEKIKQGKFFRYSSVDSLRKEFEHDV